MIMRSMAVISAIAVGTLMAASPAPAATEAPIEITDQGFTPDSIEIAGGDVVEWRNTDQVAHTVTAENGSFDSGPLEPGASFSLTFEAAGSYTYSSTGEGERAWIATVVVREAPDAEQPPTEDPPDETVIDPDASPPPVDVPEQPPTEPPGVEEADPSAADGSPSPTIQP
jgi:plastocyanin